MSDILDVKEFRKWTQEQRDRFICCLCYHLLYPCAQLGCCGKRICLECVNSLENTEFQCPSCGSLRPSANHDKGHTRDSGNSPVLCFESDCKWTGLIKDMQEHLQSHKKLECKECGKGFVSAKQVEVHRRDRCTHRMVPCRLADFGCCAKVRQSEMAKHYLDSKHQACIMSFITEILLKKNLQVDNSILENSSLEQNQNFLLECLKSIERVIEEINATYDEHITLSFTKHEIEIKITEMHEQLKKIKDGSMENIKHIEHIHQIFIEISKLVDDIKIKLIPSLTLLDSNDTFTWRVSLLNFLNGNMATVRSGLFNCSQWGYKMEVTMGLENDEETSELYVVLSFTIFRGDFDAVLVWPFPYPIKLYFIDLSGRQKHVTKLIWPDSRTEIFGRPLNVANTPYFIHQFYPYKNLIKNNSDYVRDNHIFLGIHIDFSETKVHPASPMKRT